MPSNANTIIKHLMDQMNALLHARTDSIMLRMKKKNFPNALKNN